MSTSLSIFIARYLIFGYIYKGKPIWISHAHLKFGLGNCKLKKIKKFFCFFQFFSAFDRALGMTVA